MLIWEKEFLCGVSFSFFFFSSLSFSELKRIWTAVPINVLAGYVMWGWS